MAAPVITGTATEGQILSISNGDWTNSPTSFTRQWVRCDAAGANCVVVPSTTGAWYMLAAADVGATIRCWTTSYNAIGASAPVLSAQTAVVSALAAAVPVNTTAPAITGQTVAGQVLTVSNGIWTQSPSGYLRQWLRCAPGAISFLQSKSIAQTLEPTSIAFSSNVSAGSLLIAAVTWNANTQTCSLTDNRGNTWVPIGVPMRGHGGIASYSLQIFYVANAVAGQTTVTASLTGTTARAGVAIHEYAGVAAAAPLDVWGYSFSTSTSLNTVGPVTTTVANDLLFAASLHEGGANAGAGYTLREKLNWNNNVTEDRIATSASAYTATFTPVTGDDAIMALAAFKPGSGESCASIAAATAATYALTSTDVGKTIRADVTAQNLTGNSVASRAAATAVIAPATAPPPPPSTEKLKWAAPTLTSPITIQVSNSNRSLSLAAGQDYIIKMPTTPLTTRGGLVINGGRNIRIIGGEIRQDVLWTSGGADQQYGIYSINQTGTLHIEGLRVHGAGMAQALVMAQGAGATVQVQNCRFETLHPISASIHTDGYQSWAGPNILRMYQVTIISNGVCVQTQPRQFYTGAVGTWQYERMNMVHQTANAYALWKDGSSWWNEYHFDIWLKTNPSHVAAAYNSAWAGGNNWAGWNPGGNAGTITGEAMKLGLRPQGDWVPASAAGIGYVSPGYV